VENPVFSPDGRWVAFYSAESQALRKIAVSGGPAVTLCAVLPPVPDGISWTPSGILFGQAGTGRRSEPRGIMRVPVEGGAPELLIAVKTDETASSPQLLPDNDTVLFTLLKGEAFDRWDKAAIVLQSLKSGRRTTLIEHGSDGRYVSSGYVVYTRADVLYAAPFDATTHTLTAGAVPILEGIHRSGGSVLPSPPSPPSPVKNS